jgi:hypothetical protein
MNRGNECGIYIQWILFSLWKVNLGLWKNKDEPGGSHANGNKPDSKGQNLYDPTYIRYLKLSKS